MTMKDFLKIGDVILLGAGMKVYTQVPERFVYDNHKISDEKTNHGIKIDDVLVNNINISNDMKVLAKDIVDNFSFRLGFELNQNDALRFIESNITTPSENRFVVESGEFVVLDTKMEGGGTGHGPHDVYPDGHHVFCKRMKDGKYDKNGVEVDFYQSGSFTAMIEPAKITLVKRLHRKVDFI